MEELFVPLTALAFVVSVAWLQGSEGAVAGAPTPRPVRRPIRARIPGPPTTVWMPESPAAVTAVAVYAAPARPLPAPPPAGPGMTPPRGAWQCLVGRRIEGVVTSTFLAGAHKTDEVLLMLEGGLLFELYSTGGGGLEGAGALHQEDLFGVLSSSELGPEARVYWREEGAQNPES